MSRSLLRTNSSIRLRNRVDVSVVMSGSKSCKTSNFDATNLHGVQDPSPVDMA